MEYEVDWCLQRFAKPIDPKGFGFNSYLLLQLDSLSDRRADSASKTGVIFKQSGVQVLSYPPKIIYNSELSSYNSFSVNYI